MDPRLLKYFNQELQHIREMGGEFAREFPKIAGRLGLDGFECADPYVERLLEGFGFMAARVQLKVDAEFPKFTRHLLEIVYPHYLSPTPSMAVVQLQPDLSEGDLAAGFVVPRDSVLKSLMGKEDKTACEYRTAHDVTLWPIELVKAEYVTNRKILPNHNLSHLPGAKAGIRLQLRSTAGLTFDKLALDNLDIYLHGSDELPMTLYEQIFANSLGVIVRPIDRDPTWQFFLEKSNIKRLGFCDNEALLPYGKNSFQGYRLLEEYFAFPNRFLFFRLAGLKRGISQCKDNEIDLFILLDHISPSLGKVINVSNFSLFCTPSINLFPKRADRIHLNEQQTEYHVVADRTRPMDFEVYGVNSVTGYGAQTEEKQEFLPFYSSTDVAEYDEHNSYYTIQREPRLLSARQRGYGPRSSYIGSEAFVSLVDSSEGPFRTSLRQLGVFTLCTNRDLPLMMPIGKGHTDFTMESGAPVEAVRCVAGPTKPKPALAEGESAWRLISHLSLNYLTLMDNDEKEGAAAFRDLLKLYGDSSEAYLRKQIEGIKSITAQPIVRQVSTSGQTTFGRGQEISVLFDEDMFEGTGVFLLGAVLEVFFARYVSINSFTETVIKTLNRGEIIRWPMKTGVRHTV